MSLSVSYVNPRTGKQWPVDQPLWRAPDDHGPVELTPGSGIRPADIDQSERSLWRYASAIRTQRSVTLGEGWTPLVPSRWQGREVLFKCEHMMPTGSYKDRGISVLMNELAARGIGKVLEDSSGNAGSSMATYAAAAGIACTIYAPASAPEGKLLQMEALGAELRRIPGLRQATTDAVMAAISEDSFYASHAWQPFYLDGMKTIAFELWEQLGFSMPDHVIVPTGQGANILGLAIGLAELKAAGQINRMPKLHAVQAEACPPLAAAFHGEAARPTQPSIADGIGTANPVRGEAILAAVRESGGQILSVNEDEITAALRGLLAGGWYVEPTSAAGAAGLTKLLDSGRIGKEETAVLILTGHGLKASQSIAAAISG
jgi:threonine synthase